MLLVDAFVLDLFLDQNSLVVVGTEDCKSGKVAEVDEAQLVAYFEAVHHSRLLVAVALSSGFAVFAASDGYRVAGDVVASSSQSACTLSHPISSELRVVLVVAWRRMKLYVLTLHRNGRWVVV